jgi:hypothetical protein
MYRNFWLLTQSHFCYIEKEYTLQVSQFCITIDAPLFMLENPSKPARILTKKHHHTSYYLKEKSVNTKKV